MPGFIEHIDLRFQQIELQSRIVTRPLQHLHHLSLELPSRAWLMSQRVPLSSDFPPLLLTSRIQVCPLSTFVVCLYGGTSRFDPTDHFQHHLCLKLRCKCTPFALAHRSTPLFLDKHTYSLPWLSSHMGALHCPLRIILCLKVHEPLPACAVVLVCVVAMTTTNMAHKQTPGFFMNVHPLLGELREACLRCS